MRALVTGANGLLGANLVRVLLADGEQEVRAMVRPTSDTRSLDGLDIERVIGDVRDPGSLRQAMDGCQIVYHLAAVYRIVGGSAEEIIGTAVEGTRNALEAIAAVGSVERVVCTSSAVAVGMSSSPHDICTEDWRWNLEDAYPYIVAKRRSEGEALRLAAQRSLPVVVVNPSGVLGRWDTKPTPSASSVLTSLNAIVPVPFYPVGGVNMVDAEDVATGHLLAARKGRVGERYILGGDNVTYRELLETLADVTGIMRPLLPIPPAVGYGLGALLELGGALLGKDPPLTRDLARWHFGKYQYFSSARAKTELGYQARPLREVLRRSVHWFIEQGWVRAPSRLRLA